MISIERKNNEEIKDIITIVKASAILFCIVALVSNVDDMREMLLGLDGDNISRTLTVWGFFSFVYVCISLIINTKKIKQKRYYYSLFERVVCSGLLVLVVVISGTYQSDYKFIFLFLVIHTTLEDGMIEGFLITLISSIMIFSIDYIWIEEAIENVYYQNDFILFIVFLLIAWIMGYFIKSSSKKVSELMSLVEKDALTGLHNYEYLIDMIKKCKEDKKLNKNGVGLVLFDIDYFKEYNELYGKAKGDEVLKCIASLLRECTTKEYVACRISGGMFAVLLPNLCLDKTVRLGESIRKSVHDEQFSGEENQPNGRITVTVGISHYPENEEDIDFLFKAAQEALSKGKILNRNSVEVYIDIMSILETENKTFKAVMKSLLVKINEKDKFSYTHIQRVVMFAKLLAKELKLSEADTAKLTYAAYMHDIGKFNIREEILSKKSELTEDEWIEIKRHPIYSVEIMSDSQFIEDIQPIVLHHHERFDGKGYPQGLKGDKIPYLARILTVVDSFDAMTSYRPYSRIKTYSEAAKELRDNAGTQFDPKIVDAFIKSFNRYNE